MIMDRADLSIWYAYLIGHQIWDNHQIKKVLNIHLELFYKHGTPRYAM